MYPQSMFWSKIRKNRYTPSFSILKWGSRGNLFHGHVFQIFTAGSSYTGFNVDQGPKSMNGIRKHRNGFMKIAFIMLYDMKF